MTDKDTFFSKKRTLRCRGKLLNLDGPKAMGILNLTPDSFYSTSRKNSIQNAIQHAERILVEGADFIDIGAYSSRPGAEDISNKEELGRLIPVVGQIKEKFPDAILSIDTFRAGIAAYMIEKFNIDMVNDISAGNLDPEMYDVISEYQVPYIMMHMKGTPQTMQSVATYEDVTKEVMMFFAEKLHQLNDKKIHDIIIDPGFGFGKTIGHNFELLRNLHHFAMVGLPLLVGLSRKSMVYKTLNETPETALPGTIALQTVALEKGADILRVHDVREAKDAIRMVQKLYEPHYQGGNAQ